MALGEEVTLTIERMGQSGDGVARMADGRLAFVPGALPGESVRARVIEERRHFVRASVTHRALSSPERVKPVCPIVSQCGGCVFQHWDYRAELAYKENRVRQALLRVALSDRPVQAIRASSDPYAYRNKGQFPVGGSAGHIVLGLYRRGTHEVVAAAHCDIQDPWVNQALAVVGPALSESGLPPWRDSDRTGILRHVLIRSSHREKRVLVLLIVSAFHPALSRVAHDIRRRLPLIAGVGANINPHPGNRVLGAETTVLSGEPYITDAILGLTFRISFTSFFQVNPDQAAVLYHTALSFLPHRCEEIWDLYAGVGTLAALASERALTVRALESHPQAVHDAKENFALNHLENIEIEAGRVEDIMARWIRGDRRPPEAVIVDPPRSGLDGRVIDHLIALKPAQIVYVSCNPETWARDLTRLAPHYGLEKAVPVDMFPRTDHVEVASGLVLQYGQ